MANYKINNGSITIGKNSNHKLTNTTTINTTIDPLTYSNTYYYQPTTTSLNNQYIYQYTMAVGSGNYVNNTMYATGYNVDCPLCKESTPSINLICCKCNNYAIDPEFYSPNKHIYTERFRVSPSALFTRTKLRKDYGDCYLFYGLNENFSFAFLNLDYYAEEKVLYIPIEKYPELNSTNYQQILEIIQKLLLLV